MTNITKIPIEIYGFDIHLHLADKMSEALYKLKIPFVTDWSEEMMDVITAFTTNKSPEYTLGDIHIVVDRSRVTLNDLNHEINHAVVIIMEIVGMEHNRETTEAFAYLSDYIFKEILKVVRADIGVPLFWRE